MSGKWTEGTFAWMYVHPEFGVMCRVHPFNDGWMLSVSPSVRSRLSLDVFFDNIFPTPENAIETFEGLVTVLQIKENNDGRSST
jgi:hypothetical protein